MINQLSTYLQGKLLNNAFRDTAYTPPTTVYCALFTTQPNAGGTGGTEVSGSGYTRVAVTFGAPSSGVILNSAQITFPTAPGSWGTIVSACLYDAATSGNLLALGSLSSATPISVGQSLTFPDSEFEVQLV